MLHSTLKPSVLGLIGCLLGTLWGCAAAPPPEVTIPPYEAEIERLNQTVLDQREELDRLSASVEALQVLSTSGRTKKNKAKEPEVSVKAPTATKPAPTPTKQRDPMATLYLRGLQSYEAKEYGDAIEVMTRFLKLAPTHVYADRAQFLKADAYYKNAEYAMVLQETKDFEAKYPYSFRLPDVLYKRGLAYSKMGQKEYAASHFDQLLKRFPDTEVAALSKKESNAAP